MKRFAAIRPRALLTALLLVPAAAYATSAIETSGASPGWTAILPPLVAIGLALLLREVIGSLVLGIVVGSVLLSPGEPGQALLRLPLDFLPNNLADKGHASIVLFSLMLGAMVGVLAKAGGMAGIVQGLKKLARRRRGGLLVTWLLGLIIFFDDYANTLLVGNTIRPFTDRLGVSRAKLAYIVDSTAAPVASIAVISTWVGFEIGLIRDTLATMSADLGDAYVLFLQSIPYAAYSLLALLLVASIAWWGRDYGPMHQFEEDAAHGNDRSLQDRGRDIMETSDPGRFGIWIALVPIITVIVVTFAGLYISGKQAIPGEAPLFEILGQADSSAVLLAASFIGMLAASILAVFPGRIPVNDVSESLVDGIRAMMPAMVILLLAWALGDVCSRLGTAEFVINAVSGSLPPWLIPTALFLVAGTVAFSTGTSWGAMAILIPIALPLAYQLPLEAGVGEPASGRILLGSIAAVLSGATFGDHCSPISDTTVLSSMASGCNHIDHVRTQIPYAVTAGTVAIAVGYLPTGFGIPPWPGLLLGAAVVLSLPRLIGKPLSRELKLEE